MVFTMSSAAAIAEHENRTFVSPDHDHIQYRGRINVAEPLSPRLTWAGSRIDINFSGSSISAILRDAEGLNYFNAYLDEDWDNPVVLACRAGKHEYPIAENLSADRPHRLTLIKRTESREGGAYLHGFLLEPGGTILPPPELPARRIEFYGDSITSGLGNIAPDDADDRGNAIKDNTLAYGSLTARALNLDYRAISYSGIGLMKSWFNFTLPDIHDRLEGADATGPVWDFSSWIPDVVVVNVGQNDCWLLGNMNSSDEKAWIDRYKDFIRALRGHYPDALIICALGPMNATRPGSPWPGFIASAVEQLRAAGDEQLESLVFPFTGIPKHPRVRHHEAMAAQLTSFLHEKKGWQ